MSNKQLEKKILLIAYHFPPSLAVGGFRMAGFVKYLPMNGWKPYVLTLDEKYIENKDNSQLSEFEHIKITRTRLFPTLRDCYLFIKKVFHIFTNRGGVNQQQTIKKNITKITDKSGREGLIRKLKRYFTSLFITLPDTERNWIIPAIISAFWKIKHQNINMILTSGPPHSTHIVGLVINFFTNTYWIADFRDPWMTPFNKTLYPTSRLSNFVERSLEKRIFNNADLVLATTEKLTHKFKNEYNNSSPAKIRFIPNGFDEKDFNDLSRLEKYETFTISYTGSIYYGRSPEPLFRALKEMADANRLEHKNLRVKLIGHCQYIGERLTAEIVSSYGLDTVVEISDYMPYEKALEVIKKSHLALLLAPNQPYQIPAKVYDYMATGTKILALTGKGATADVINSTGLGKALKPDNIEGIKNYIFDSMLNIQNPESNEEIDCSQYNRKNIVKNLAQELDSIIRK